MEVLIAIVDDVVLWSACPDETQTLKQTMNNLHGSALFKHKNQCCGVVYAGIRHIPTQFSVSIANHFCAAGSVFFSSW